MMNIDEERALVTAACAKFPTTFGLRAFPGDVFRLSVHNSYVATIGGEVMLYTQRFKAGAWVDFAKGTAAELSRQITTTHLARLNDLAEDERPRSTYKGVVYSIGPTSVGFGWTIYYGGGDKRESTGVFYDDCDDHPEGARAWAETSVHAFIDARPHLHQPPNNEGTVS